MTVTYILAVLSQSDIVINVEVVEMNVEPTVQSLRAKATLKRGYVLYVNERIEKCYVGGIMHRTGGVLGCFHSICISRTTISQ